MYQYWPLGQAVAVVWLVEPLMQAAPSKVWVLVQAAARRHLSALGMPKSTLEDRPALGDQTLAPVDTPPQACFSCSILAESASVLIQDCKPNEFQICCFWPAGGVVMVVVEPEQPVVGVVLHEYKVPLAVR